MNRAARRWAARQTSKVRGTVADWRTTAKASLTPIVIVPVMAGTLALWPWDAVMGWFGSVASDVKGWVNSVVQSVYNWAVDRLNDVWNAFNTMLQDFWQDILWLRESASALLDGIHWLWFTVIQGIYADVIHVWNTLVGYIQDATNTASEWVTNAIHYAEDLFNKALNWVERNVYHPLLDVINQAKDWVWNTLVKPVWDWLGSAFADVWNWMQWAFGAISWLQWFIDNVVSDVVTVVHGAWDWLILAARYGIGFFEQMMNDLWRESPRSFANAMMGSLHNHPDVMESWIERFLG